MKINQSKRKAPGLPDFLPYAALVEDGIMLLNNGALMASWSFRGPDLAFATHSEMASISSQVNLCLKLGTGWVVHCDAIREYSPHYPDGKHFPDPVTRMIDAERRAQFKRAGVHLESVYYISLTYLPPLAKDEKMRGYVFSNAKKDEGVAAKHIADFKAKISSFEALFKLSLKAKRLHSVKEHDELGNDFLFDEQLRYVRRTILGEDFKFVLPKFPVYLHDSLGAYDLVGGIDLELDGKHLGVVAIEGFPEFSTPGFLAILDSLPFPYRYSTRAILLDTQDSKPLIDKLRKQWKGKQRGFFSALFGMGGGVLDRHAVLMTDQAEDAMAVAESNSVLFTRYSGHIVLMDKDAKVVAQRVGEVIKILRSIGFSARHETFNALDAWLGTLPGVIDRNPRRFYVHTLNLADGLPIASVWGGDQYNSSPFLPPQTPPLMLTTSTGATPFRLNLHVQDIGHFAMLGPTGAGKSTLLAMMAAQWFRYPKAKVIAFDKGRSLYALTHAAGGRHYDIGGEAGSIRFCPLADLETMDDRSWAAGYIEALAEMNGCEITPAIRNEIAIGIDLTSRKPKGVDRSLTAFRSTIQGNTSALKDALRDFTSTGANGDLIDADTNTLAGSQFLCFEMEALMGSGETSSRALIAVALFLFQQIEKSLDGSPTLILLDEAWVFLRNPHFSKKVLEWLKVLRKRNAVLGLATQSISDVMKSSISDVIMESCPTKILLANSEANNKGLREFYLQLGLNEREVATVAEMVKKRDYYFSSPVGKRLVNLNLGGVSLAFVGASGDEDRKMISFLINEYGPTEWVYHWLLKCSVNRNDPNLKTWAEFYRNSLKPDSMTITV
jgi:type IV secretion system protein VirB4